MRAFLEFPYKHYRLDPDFVPPLRAERRAFYDPRHNPWLRANPAQHFLARRGGVWVGRISALHNRAHCTFHGAGPRPDPAEAGVGFFGSFETVNDPAVAGALLDAAAGWLRERGLSVLRGPATFSTNDDCGLRVDGNGGPPVFLMPHNPPWYPALVEAAGFAKAKDLMAYQLGIHAPDARLARVAEAVRTRTGVTVRSLRTSRRAFDADVAMALQVYNQAWEANWGFVPMTPDEFRVAARDMKQIFDPELALLALTPDGEPVGFSVTLPDLNECLIRMGGRLFPFGIFRLLWGRRRIAGVRVITMGLIPEYRRRGIDALFYYDSMVRAQALGYRRGELSWILEDNLPMRRAAEALGARPYRTYRLYDRPIR